MISYRITTARSLGLILDRSPILIDVRTPAEFEACHPEGALNFPLDRLDPEILRRRLKDQAEEPLYLLCQGGTRAKMAQDRLDDSGIVNTVVVEGGLKAWKSEGLPIEVGEKNLSVDCQARILIGSLVVVGISVGWLLHPAGFVFAGLVGAGLVFAGATDTCAIAILLSKLPWNRSTCSSKPTSCSL